MKIVDKGLHTTFQGRLGRKYDFTPESEADQEILKYLDKASRGAWGNYYILSNRKRKRTPHPLLYTKGIKGKPSPLTISVFPEHRKF